MSRSLYFLIFSLILNYGFLILMSLGHQASATDLALICALAQPGGYVFGLFAYLTGLCPPWDPCYYGPYYIIFTNIFVLLILEVMILMARGAREKPGLPEAKPVDLSSIVFDRNFFKSNYACSLKNLIFALLCFLILIALAISFVNPSDLPDELEFQIADEYTAWAAMPVAFFSLRVVFFTFIRTVSGLAGKRLKWLPAPQSGSVGPKYIKPVALPFGRVALIILSGRLSGIVGAIIDAAAY